MLPRAAHAQRGEIRHRAPERPSQVVPGRPQLRHPELPGGERGPDPVDLVAEVTLRGPRLHLDAVLNGEHVDPQLPALAGLQGDPVAHRSLLDLAAQGEQHLRLTVEVVGGAEQEPVLRLVEEGRHQLGRERPGRVAEREIEGLDREDVREVGADVDGQLELDRPIGVVDEDHVLLHPVTDETPPRDRDLVGTQAADGGIPQEPDRREVLDLPLGEQERPCAVDGQRQAGEEARVRVEEAGRRLPEVAELVRHAEGRALENRDLRHAVSTRPGR